MKSARESRIEANDVLESCRTKELKKVEKAINNATKDGVFKVCIDGALTKETVIALNRLGYTLETGGRYNEIDTVIFW